MDYSSIESALSITNSEESEINCIYRVGMSRNI